MVDKKPTKQAISRAAADLARNASTPAQKAAASAVLNKVKK